MDSECHLPETMAIDDNQHYFDDKLLIELPSQYELQGLVSEGGMGSIYKAQNRYTGAVVAIKLMRFEASRNTDAIRRFYLEAKAASLLKHHNICRLLDFGVTKSGMPYLVMDWIEGISLEQRVICDRKLSVTDAILIFKQVAAALAHAHSKKIVHRDLKPENIMLSQNVNGNMEVQLVDFGIAKFFSDDESNILSNGLTKTGVAVGTPKYMSPEQATGGKIDNRTDMYSLACVMYFALSGNPPFSGNTVADTLKKHLYEKPPEFNASLGIPAQLQTILFKAMEKNPNRRYANMEEIIMQLDELIANSNTTIQAAIQKNVKQNKLSWMLWFALSFLAVYAISMALQHFLDASDGQGKTSAIYHKKLSR